MACPQIYSYEITHTTSLKKRKNASQLYFNYICERVIFSKLYFLIGRIDHKSNRKSCISEFFSAQSSNLRKTALLHGKSYTLLLILINMIDNSHFIKNLRDFFFLRHDYFINWRWDALVFNYTYFSNLLLCLKQHLVLP